MYRYAVCTQIELLKHVDECGCGWQLRDVDVVHSLEKCDSNAFKIDFGFFVQKRRICIQSQLP